MPTKVYLIGTDHPDLKGEERLDKLLDRYKPDIIIKEVGAEDSSAVPEKYRDIPFEELVKIIKTRHPSADGDTRTICSFWLALGYEYRSSLRYSKKNNIEVLCIDDSSAVNEIVKPANAAIKKSVDSYFPLSYFNLRMSPKEYSCGVDKYYRENRTHLSKIDWAREKLWEKAIRKQKGIVVGVFGFAHIFGTHHNLYDRLSDLSVERILLCDADQA